MKRGNGLRVPWTVFPGDPSPRWALGGGESCCRVCTRSLGPGQFHGAAGNFGFSIKTEMSFEFPENRSQAGVPCP